MGLQRGRKEFVASHGFLWRDAPKLPAELPGPLGQKRRPHLQDAIRKPGLKNTMCNRRKG